MALVGVLLFHPAQSRAAQVFNPGPFTSEITGGYIRIGDQRFDIGGGDNNPTVSGSIAANGAVSIPPSGISFPQTVLPDSDTGAGFDITVSILPTTTAWTGSLDPLTGVSNIAGSLRVQLEGGSGLTGLGSSCFIGNASAGISLALTSGSMPPVGANDAIDGTPYDESTGKVTLVNNSFSVPGASGCGLLGLGNSAVNDALGLPSGAGSNATALEFTFNPKPLAPIRPSFTATPNQGKAPVTVNFDASATTVQEDIAPITEYRWDYNGDGTDDQVTNGPTVSHEYEDPGVYQVRMTAATEDGTTESATRTVTITGAVAAITERPPQFTNSTTANFEFTNSEGTDFECRLDNAAEFTPCATPLEITGLAQGQHTFRVRALDDEGSPGLPATYQWTVDLTNPAASFTAGPPARTNSLTEADLEFTGTDNISSPGDLTFECRYDSTEDDAWESCTSPQHVEWELEEGTHTFDIRAKDQAGNVSNVTTRTWVVDLTPPSTNITGQPVNTLTNTPATIANPTNQSGNANSQFGFNSNEAGTFICQFNNAAERACQTPIQTGTGTGGTPSQARLGAPSQGTNTFKVWAVDQAGNRDPVGQTYQYTYDNVQPTVTLPAGFLPALRTQATSFNVLALSNEAIAGTSAANAGSGFECSFDSTTVYTPCTQVINNMTARYERTGIAQGAHTIRVRATDLAGNLASGNNIATYAYTVDLTAPVATINSGPATGSSTNSGNATFTFSATDAFPTGENATITFECRRDAQAFAPCTGGTQSYSGLANGAHTFDVRPVDQAGNVGAVVSRTWTVGTGSVTLDSKPAQNSNTNAPTFVFSSPNGTDTFECRQKSGTEFTDINASWAPCTSPKGYTGLAQGSQWFEVRTVAADTVTRGFPTVYNWFVDTVAPTVSITGGPAAVTNATTNSGTITFTTADASPSSGSLQLECRYDSTDPADWQPCTSPQNVNWNPVHGEQHNFQVRSTDAAGNVSNVQTRTWTVDAQPPTPTVSWMGPAITSQLGSANSVNRFDYGSNEATGSTAASAFRCQVNDAAERNCAATTAGGLVGNLQTGTGNQTGPSQARFGTPVQGVNTLKVWAIDAVGNRSPDPATAQFTYDTVQPTVTAVLPATTVRTNSTSGYTYLFTANEVVDRFECSFDSTSAYSTCSGSGSNATAGTHQISGPIAEGTHTIRVRGVDRATPANVSSGNNIATYTLIVDLTNPIVAISDGPADGSTVSDTDATFTFATTNSAGNQNTFECRIDGGDWEPCGNAAGNADNQKSYEDLADGEHTFDVRATDEAGNTGDAVSRTWTVDLTGPDAEIGSGPDARTASTDATFEFGSDEATATFECKLDGGDWEACESPVDLSDLAEGNHRFKVRAIDELGNYGSPVAYEWEIDLTGPETSIDSAPSGQTNSTDAEFEFSSEDGATFECRIDGGDWEDCDSPQAYTDLTEGDHSFEVRATDDLGNTGPAASHDWEIDLTGPVANIDSGPNGLTNSTGAQFGFSSEDGATFECKLDGGDWEDCGSPKAYSGLGDGGHTFAVRATDQAGNTGSASTRDWSVDATAPNAQINSGPSGTTTETSAQFGFGADENGSTFECSLDGAAFAACTSPQAYNGLALGEHTFRVRAIDQAGNTGLAASRTWTVEEVVKPPAQAPVITLKDGPVKIGSSRKANVGQVQCRNQGSCTVTAKSAKVKIGKKSFSAKLKVAKNIAQQSTEKITLALPKKALKPLKKKGAGTANVSISVSSANGTKASLKQKIALKPNKNG